MSRRNQEHSERQHEEDTVESTDDMQGFIDRALGMPMFIDEVGGPPIPRPHPLPNPPMPIPTHPPLQTPSDQSVVPSDQLAIGRRRTSDDKEAHRFKFRTTCTMTSCPRHNVAERPWVADHKAPLQPQ